MKVSFLPIKTGVVARCSVCQKIPLMIKNESLQCRGVYSFKKQYPSGVTASTPSAVSCMAALNLSASSGNLS
ncbi:MAG: hypothetical protein ACRC6S_14045, partial [Shewanella sp.]